MHLRSYVDNLKQCINRKWAALSQAVIERTVGKLRQHLCACVCAGGRHFEHRLY